MLARDIMEGLGATTVVEKLMTRDPVCCTPDSDLQAVERIMGEKQVRRIPITDAGGCCVGIVAQADLALAEWHGLSESEVGRVWSRSRKRATTTTGSPVHRFTEQQEGVWLGSAGRPLKDR